METRHQDAFQRFKKKLLRRARRAREQANSYRGFKVGAAVLAWNGKRYGIFSGANFKPVRGGWKACAEQVAVLSAMSGGYSQIVAVVVIGEPQRHEEDTVTLHPCKECRRMFVTTGCGQDMIVLTTYNGTEEVHSLAELLARHQYDEQPLPT